MQLAFGAGDIFGVPLTDASGNAIVNPTPIKLGITQEIGVEFSGDLKELYGQNQFAVAIGRGKVKVSAKCKFAQMMAAGINSLFFGQTVTAGTLSGVYADVTGAAVPTTPFTITPVPPSSGTWVEDLGVVNASGVAMTRVASGPTTGQYSVAAGVYTFAAADTGLMMFISYRYTATLTGAKKIAVQNLPMGYAPTFKAYLQTVYGGKRALVVLYNATAPKLNLFATKLDDFNLPELNFSGQSDAANNVADIWLQE